MKDISNHGIPAKGISFDHPQFGQVAVFPCLGEDEDGTLICNVGISVQIPTNSKPTELRLLATLPASALLYEEHLSWAAFRGFPHYGWEPDPADVQRIREECDRWNATEWVPLSGRYSESEIDFGDDDRRRESSTTYDHTWWQDPTGYFKGDSRHKKSQWRVFFSQPGKRDAEQEIKALFPLDIWLEHWLPELLPQWEAEYTAKVEAARQKDFRPFHERVLDEYRHHKFEEGGVKFITAVHPRWRDSMNGAPWEYQVGTWENRPGWHKSRPVFLHGALEFYDRLLEDEWEKFQPQLDEVWATAKAWTPQIQAEKDAVAEQQRQAKAIANRAELEALAAAARNAGFTVVRLENDNRAEEYRWYVEGSFSLRGYGRKGCPVRNPLLTAFCADRGIFPADASVDAALQTLTSKARTPFSLAGKQGTWFVQKLYGRELAEVFASDCEVRWDGRCLRLKPSHQTGLLIGRKGVAIKSVSERLQVKIIVD